MNKLTRPQRIAREAAALRHTLAWLDHQMLKVRHRLFKLGQIAGEEAVAEASCPITASVAQVVRKAEDHTLKSRQEVFDAMWEMRRIDRWAKAGRGEKARGEG